MNYPALGVLVVARLSTTMTAVMRFCLTANAECKIVLHGGEEVWESAAIKQALSMGSLATLLRVQPFPTWITWPGHLVYLGIL